MNRIVTIFLMSWLTPNLAIGQSAPEHHVWQDKRSFEPMSRTAEVITGPIKLSGNKKFASPGSKMTIAFGNRKSATLTAAGASWRQWNDADPAKVTAEVFRLDRDPGKLINGNTLCGDPAKNPARYIVFYEGSLLGKTPLLGVAVFESRKAPKDINSAGLCGTFSFYVD